ncbi:hypothetical protein CIL05_12705 [Virgibacillus profundi]|uniref:Uncharacterized protein n=1 Tax=Virgibacillus profundi TaxID=2024555 RepID=A0A2A2IDP0_9BACI|nr:hypothetical protein [Virgibacillus profundi]PAV29250.1 hypothetical protein CIL05_12705 [Virgibacillus profundi]PXY53419.1 hypothetical protein CIT14_12830 [Virgibacillus profundi]
MSLVMSVVMNHVAVISGDLRAVNANNTCQKMGGVKKIYKHNKKVVYGLTGDLSEMVILEEHINQSANAHANAQGIAKLIRKFLQSRLLFKPALQLRAHIVGVGENGKISMIELMHDDKFAPHVTIPGEQQANWSVMYSNEPAEPILAEQFQNLSEYTVQSLTDMLQSVNVSVAKVDDFVSTECETLTVLKT